MISGILVRLGHNPSGCIRNTQIENFALDDEVVETVHDLFDRGNVIPPMDVQNVDIGCTKVLQTFFDRKMQRFDMVA